MVLISLFDDLEEGQRKVERQKQCLGDGVTETGKPRKAGREREY